MGRRIVNPTRFTVRFTARGSLAEAVIKYTEEKGITAQALAALAVSKYLGQEDQANDHHPSQRPSRAD